MALKIPTQKEKLRKQRFHILKFIHKYHHQNGNTEPNIFDKDTVFRIYRKIYISTMK